MKVPRLILLFCCFSGAIFGQNDYEQAVIEFDKGNFEAVIAQLNEAESGLTNNIEKIKVRSLLCSTFIETGDAAAATAVYQRILSDAPWYLPENAGQAVLAQAYQVNRKLDYSFYVLTSSLTNTSIDKNYIANGIVEISEKYEAQGLGYGLGVNLGYFLLDSKLEISVGLSFQRLQHAYTAIFDSASIVNQEPSRAILATSETQQFLNTALRLRYFPIAQNADFFRAQKKWLLFFAVQSSMDFLLNARLESPFIFFDTPAPMNRASGDIDLLQYDLRHKFTPSFAMSVGIEKPITYRKKINHLFAEIGYSFQLASVVNKQNRFDHPFLKEQFFYLDNDFRSGFIFLRAGITFTAFKVSN